MSARSYIVGLAAAGRYHFTTDEATAALGVSAVAARAALRRLAEHGELAMPSRSFWVIVPPEYRRLGCLPGEQFVPQLMERLGLAYYVGLLSAAQYHGAAHHRPQELQIVVEKNRRPIECGVVKVAFTARKDAAKVPTVLSNTPRGVLRVSTVEATALDLIGYPSHAGGLDNVATVLRELAERIDPVALALVAKVSPLTWAQRLGYLLDTLGFGERTEPLAAHVNEHNAVVVPLSPSGPAVRYERSQRWRIIVNEKVEPET